MAEQDLFPAVWDGPYDAYLPDRSILHIGDERLVSAAELESGHWTPVEPETKPKAGKPADKPSGVND